MPLAYDKIFATAANKTANQTSLVATASATVTVGQWVLVCVAKDNTATTNANVTEMSVADSAGNTYTRVLERNSGTSAQTGTTLGLFIAHVTTQITNASTTVTATLGGTSSNNDAQAVVGYAFTKDAAGTATVQSSTSASSADSADPGAVTLSSLPSREYLLFHAISWEGISGDTWTADADYSQKTGSHTSGGAAGTNQSVVGSTRVATLTTDTFDGALTTDRDAAQIFAAFYEVITNHVMPAALGAFTLSGQAAILKAARLLVGASGSFSFSGQAATLSRGFVLPAAAGSFALSGQFANFLYSRVMPATVGSFTFTGQTAALKYGRVLAADVGSVALNGQAATLAYGRKLTADVASFAFTGQSANLVYQPAGSYSLSADAGSFNFTGQAVGLRAARALVADGATFAFNGQANLLTAARTLTAASAALTFTGQPATLAVGGTDRALAAEAGVFALSGSNVTFAYFDRRFQRIISIGSTVYSQATQESGRRIISVPAAVYSQATQQSGQRILAPEG